MQKYTLKDTNKRIHTYKTKYDLNISKPKFHFHEKDDLSKQLITQKHVCDNNNCFCGTTLKETSQTSHKAKQIQCMKEYTPTGAAPLTIFL